MEALLDWNCTDSIHSKATCSDSEYMELIQYKTTGDCTENAISDTEYDSKLVVTNQCMKRLGGGGVLYQCTNNQNEEGLPGGYRVTTFYDDECLQQNESTFYGEIGCFGNMQRRQHMVFCNGENAVILESDDEEKEPVLDCNYFVNSVDPLGVIGQPLNECIDMENHHAMYSKKYQCNADKNGIEEVIYKNTGCNQQDLELVVPRSEITDFYCESRYECHAIMVGDDESEDTDGDTEGDEGDIIITPSTVNAVMIGKQYINETCESADDAFWYSQHILIDRCWPLGTGLYAVMSCDDLGFVHYSLYNDAQCTVERFNLRFEEFDCIFGKLFEVTFCPNWEESASSTTTTTTTTVSPQSATNQNESVDTETLEPETTSYDTTILYTTDTTDDDVEDSSTTEQGVDTTEPLSGGDPDLLKNEEECINMFGGGDVGGLDCHYFADIIWAFIVMACGLIACLLCWCWNSRDSDYSKGPHASFSSRSSSRLSISNGHGNDDIKGVDDVPLNNPGGQHAPGVQVADDSDWRNDADDERDEVANIDI